MTFTKNLHNLYPVVWHSGIVGPGIHSSKMGQGYISPGGNNPSFSRPLSTFYMGDLIAWTPRNRGFSQPLGEHLAGAENTLDFARHVQTEYYKSWPTCFKYKYIVCPGVARWRWKHWPDHCWGQCMSQDIHLVRSSEPAQFTADIPLTEYHQDMKEIIMETFPQLGRECNLKWNGT